LPILPGITRDTLLTLSRELGVDASEGLFTVDELDSADEVFIAGTTAEITPVRELSGRKPGAGLPGPITTKLLAALQAANRAESPEKRWSSIATEA
jgi:branched-chain amino acid aminotransferase